MPRMISTFSWSISRSASLMATSALLCESAFTGSTLYLPSTPPCSLARSMAICAPIAQGSDPAGEVIEHADPDGFFLGAEQRWRAQQRARRQAGRRELEHGTPCLHEILP